MSILQRADIAIDMAHALNYLHHDCETPIVHCDLKPSNILLDHDMIAHVGDFGLAKILTQPQHGVRGTVGYVAPEYGLGSEASTDGDVYSYGILLLELMTGKRPTDSMFKEGFNIHMYAKAALPDQVMQIVDHSLQDNEITEEVENRRAIIDTDHQKRECIFTLVSVGVGCSTHSPEDRMKIPDVISKLVAAKDNLLNATSRRHRSTI
ncbi:putative LRR receptor-like serine/threonine-protein kinase At3g47570 [Silene latifolia]|uniref:putative LRR receptor-like serine/threonine-protein kinase At3g47570 n=1 Tax=Silene latifolia TaxID=37657 RepID=UPI003D786AD2